MGEWLRALWESFRNSYWSRWTPVERATFGAVAAVVGIVLLALIFAPAIVGGTGYATLATNVSPEDLPVISNYLNRQGVDYRLADNGATVLVPKQELYRAKFDLGSEILPTGGRRGFKIFEEPRLGITNQYFQQQKIHALEVELQRTLRAGTPQIENVFVHLNIPEEALFRKEQRLPSATVKVIERGRLDAENVEAIQSIVAYAVDGLLPERVKVVNSLMRILAGAKERDRLSRLTDEQLQTTRELEKELEQKATEVLLKWAPRAVVKVTLDLDFKHVDSTETTYDPESVVVSEETETESTTESAAGAVPGTPANVPGAAVSAAGGTTTSHESEKTRTNYEVGSLTENRMVRDLEIKRMSVAALVDGATENLEAMASLVKNAVGYEENRDGPAGFTLRSIRFDTSEEERLQQEAEVKRRSDLIVAGIYAALVLLVFLGMVLLVYYTYKRRLRAHEYMLAREREVMKETVEMKERREMTLEELGIAEVGDISQLPPEEQRRVKLRRKIEEFAVQRPKDFAKIVKTWLSE